MNKLASAFNWRPQTPFYYGWLVLGVVASGNFVATTVAGVVLGGIQFFIFSDTGWNRSSIGLAAASGVWASGIVAPFAGRLADRYGPRNLMACGTVLLGLCLLGMSWFHSLWFFYVATIFGRAVSQPLLIGVVPRTLAVNFFRRRRNTALALTGMFRPISGAIIVQIVSLFALTYGWRAAFGIFGIVSLLLTFPIYLVVRRRPEDIGLLPDGDQPTQDQAASGSRQRGSGSSAGAREEVSWTGRQALRTRAFWLIALTAFLTITGSSSVGFSLVPYLHEHANISATAAVGVLSLTTVLSLANLGWGYIADRISPRWALLIGLIGSSCVVLYLFLVNSLVSAYVFGIMWGLLHSSLEAVVYMILAHYFGRGSYGAIAGALRPFEAAGLGLGQMLGPVIYDLVGTYTSMIGMAAVLHLAAAGLIFLARRPQHAALQQPAGSMTG